MYFEIRVQSPLKRDTQNFTLRPKGMLTGKDSETLLQNFANYGDQGNWLVMQILWITNGTVLSKMYTISQLCSI